MNKEFNMNKSCTRKVLSESISLSLNKLALNNNVDINNTKNHMKNKYFSYIVLGLGSALTFLPISQCNYAYAQEIKETKQEMIREDVNRSVETSNLSFKFKNTTAEPKIYHIDGTKKLIIDFDQAAVFKEEPSAINNVLISNLTTQRNGKKLRVAIDTIEAVHFKINKENNEYILVLTKANEFKDVTTTFVNTKVEASPTLVTASPITSTVSEKIVKVEENTNTTLPLANSNLVNSKTESKVATQISSYPTMTELEHINIKANGKNAKLTLDLSDQLVVPNVTKSGNLLIIDLPNVKIPEEFQKNVPVLSLGTVVQNMDVATQKGSGRIVLSQSDNWDYSVYQMDRKFVVEVKMITKDMEKEKEVYKGKPLTLNFQNMDVRAVLQVIADFTGINIMTSDAVTGTMTVRLKDVPWDQALDLVLEAKGLQKQKQGNVVWVATRTEIADKNKSQLELNNQAAELAPLKLEFIQLNHYKAKEMKEILEGKSGGESGGDKSQPLSLISKRGSVGVDVRNNKLFVQETEAKLEEITKIIRRLDVASKQVLIDAKLVVVDDKFGKEIGAKFGFGVGKRNGNTGIGLSNNLSNSGSMAVGPTSTTANGVTTTTLPALGTAFNMPASGGGSIGFTILNALTGNQLSLELSALEENNRGKVISKPSLLTADNTKAEIRQGTEIPYVTPGSANSPPTVAFKDAVLSLNVTPQVSPNGRVTMNLDITKDTVGQLVSVQGGGSVPSIDTRKITTQVTVGDGQTVVLGGIYEVTSREDLSKIPLLGDIPFVGNLFKNTNKTNEKVELLIFITPHIILDEDLDAINAQEQNKLTEFDFKKK